MKLIHVPFCFRPDPIGGTEVYVESLAREQLRRGIDVSIAAPAQHASSRVDNGLQIHRFAVSAAPRLNDLYGDGDPTASEELAALVDRERPCLVHLHTFSSAVSAPLACALRQRGVRLVFTYHTPTVSCLRGTLLRWGSEVCDGRMEVHRCSRCNLHGYGAGRHTAAVVGTIPGAVGRLIASVGASGGAWTALRMTSLVELQQAAFRSFVGAMDRIVVLCRWTRDLLLLNGVKPEKIVHSPHGVDAQQPREDAQRAKDGVLRLAFLGRLHPTKGLDLLLRAVAGLPRAPLTLDVFGISESSEENNYVRSLRTLAACDPRVRFHPPVPADDVPAVLRTYDLVAVPSRWLETGPLVVLEAFAAGIPVIGSRLGGIAELVQDGVDGILFEPESAEAIASALEKLLREPLLLTRLREHVRPPRRMAVVADDMEAVYAEILAH